MRRLAPFLVLAFVLAGCGGKEIVSPTAETVIGTVTAEKQQAAGDAKAGAALFKAQGCGGCHTFKPAVATGTVGPDLDKLKEEAAKANRGPLDKFIEESIVDPAAYIAPGYSDLMPHIFKQQIPPDQLQQLVQYLSQGAK